MPNGATSVRLASLDSLRGVAILAVVVSHCLGTVRLGEGLDPAVVQLGRGGVTLFFLLSGYLIFHNLQRQSFGTFLCRRFFKVMPSYWCNIAVILAADLCLDNVAHHPVGSYLAGVFAVSDLLGIEAVSGVFWTLLIEIKFYIFIALQFALFRGRYTHGVLAALLLAEAMTWAVRGHGSLTLAYFPVFYLGIEISQADAAGWNRRAMLRLAVVTTALAASLALFLDQHQLGSAAYLVASVLSFVVVLRKSLSHRLAGFLGVTSYSNYLYHSLIAGLLFSWFGNQQHALAAGAILALALVTTTAFGAALYGLVEVPMVRLGRRLTE